MARYRSLPPSRIVRLAGFVAFSSMHALPMAAMLATPVSATSAHGTLATFPDEPGAGEAADMPGRSTQESAAMQALRTPEPPMPLQRLVGRITIDGRPDEAAWQAITPLPLTMYLPVFRGAPTQRSEIRVTYDDENFYAAGWFRDDDPSGIRINSLYRDRWNGDDAFAIYIDPFNDNRNAKWFGTTPAGIRFETLVSDDGATLNGNWDTFWEARATVTGEGWFAEVRIPFSSLGFQTVDGDAVMGLTVTRLVSRLNERVTFPAIDPRFEFRQPSVAQDVRLSGVRSGRPLYATPYALTGVEQSPVLATDGSDFSRDRTVPR